MRGRRRWLTGATAMALAATLVAAGCADGDDQPGAGAGGTTTTSRPASTSRDLPTTVEQVPDLPGFNVYRPTDLDATGAPLPVVVWANGGCFPIDAPWKTLLEGVASAGFVVAAITGDGSGSRSTADDQARAIDWVVAQDEGATSPYAGHLDRERVVAAGNSCGGITSLTLAARDERVRAVFVLSGSSAAPGSTPEQIASVMGAITVPVGYAVGGAEDIAGAEAIKDFDALPAGVPAYIARRSSGDHRTVSTDPAIQAEVAEIAINWLDLALFGSKAAEQALLDAPCGTCAPGLWTPQAKNLGSLV